MGTLNYIPYGDEWTKEMMRIPKHYLSDKFGISGEGITKKEQVKRIRQTLLHKFKCPRCKSEQTRITTFVAHKCKSCKYIIVESEWHVKP